MTIKELEQKIKDENLLTVDYYGIKKTYRNVLYKDFTNCPDCFGIIDYCDGDFAWYVTDSERGGMFTGDDCDNEDDVCNELYKYLCRRKQIELEEK